MQVRCVAWTELGILTGSRDKTIRIWKEAANGGITCEHVLVGFPSTRTLLAHRPEYLGFAQQGCSCLTVQLLYLLGPT